MRKIVKEHIDEGYGAGFSVSSFRGGSGGTSRGGFGGASNLGGSNMMYTYEIKPLNHTLEQKPTTDANSQVPVIQMGSKISGYAVKSNATPDKEKRIFGIVQKIVKTQDSALKYYVVRDEANQRLEKIEPLSAELITHQPIEYYNDNELAQDRLPSRRREKIENSLKGHKIVRESINKKEA